MACPDAQKLDAFVQGAVPAGEVAGLNAHLEGCPTCRTLLAELKEISTGRTLRKRTDPGDVEADSFETLKERGLAKPPQPAGRRQVGLPRGARVGRYVILEGIAAGGMGEVYAAYDPQLDRKVALKLLRPDVAKEVGQSEARDRLLREAQVMARLSHRNVVIVHDAGATDEGRIFLAMEFVEGLTLREHLRKKVRPWGEVVELFLEAGRGLAAAHAAGIIHRDFKPNNVLVAKDGRVCVLDFGIARATVVEESEATPRSVPDEVSNPSRRALEVELTVAGATMGTPGYMSPEQLRGTPVDARTDQFSFSVALYEALHGARPFRAPTLRGLLKEIESGVVPDPPSGSSVPPRVQEVIRRGLAVKSEARFESMEALLAALAIDPKVHRRNRVYAVFAGLGVAGLMMGAWGLLGRGPSCDEGARKLAGVWDAARKEQVHGAFVATGAPYADDAFRGVDASLDQWSRAWVDTSREVCVATRVRGDQSEEAYYLRMVCLERRLSQARALTEVLALADSEVVSNAVVAASVLDSGATCSGAEALGSAPAPPSGPVLASQVERLRERLAQVQALRDSGQYLRGVKAAEPLAVEARATGYRPVEAEALLMLARLQDRAADYKAAEQSVHEAARAAQAAGWTAAVADAWILLVSVVGAHDFRPAEAERWVGYAQAAVAGLPRSAAREADLEQAIASELVQAGRFGEAVTHGAKALGVTESAYGPDDLRVAVVADQLAWANSWLGRQDEALAYGQRALSISEKRLGGEHPEVARVLADVAAIEEEMGRFDDARRHHEKALAIRERAFGREALPVAGSLNNLGLVYLRLDRYAEADAGFMRALAILRARAGANHPSVGLVLDSLGDSKRLQGHSAEALALFKQGLEVHTANYGPEHLQAAYYLTGIGQCLTDLGRAAEGLAPLERALVLREREKGLPIELGRTRAALAEALVAARKDRPRAKQLALSARDDFKAAGAKAGRESARLEGWLAAQRGL